MRSILALIVLILSSSIAFGAYTTAFMTLDKNDFPRSIDTVALENLPRVRSQGGFGACVGYSTAAIAQFYHCKHSKITNCANVPMNLEISPIHMQTYANRSNDTSSVGTSIKFGGDSAMALQSLARYRVALAESCYPFDQVVNKYGDDDRAVDAMLERLRSLYRKNRETEASVCLECLQQAVQQDLKSNPSIRDIQRALQKDTFEEFLYDTTIGSSMEGPDCDIVSLRPRPNFKIFPEIGKTATPQETINKMKEILQSGYPFDYGGVCPYRQNGECLGLHSVAVTGYRKQCTRDGKNCRELIRVQNSWGEEWQQQNDDGWVDALSFLENKPVTQAQISWLSDK